jgi:hypothetical protein
VAAKYFLCNKTSIKLIIYNQAYIILQTYNTTHVDNAKISTLFHTFI